ncbi:hypothetical protein M9H77_14356 [Catharanthus roseus]|uniref:Uncharacterized protein n=1 Tax=Catharanthus roseus TaxID=4058 RepID=A0ACC0BN32_CATRO|nr:hypothetical protein M9H77_14356 [Catharanthus roseus]
MAAAGSKPPTVEFQSRISKHVMSWLLGKHLGILSAFLQTLGCSVQSILPPYQHTCFPYIIYILAKPFRDLDSTPLAFDNMFKHPFYVFPHKSQTIQAHKWTSMDHIELHITLPSGLKDDLNSPVPNSWLINSILIWYEECTVNSPHSEKCQTKVSGLSTGLKEFSKSPPIPWEKDTID